MLFAILAVTSKSTFPSASPVSVSTLFIVIASSGLLFICTFTLNLSVIVLYVGILAVAISALLITLGVFIMYPVLSKSTSITTGIAKDWYLALGFTCVIVYVTVSW